MSSYDGVAFKVHGDADTIPVATSPGDGPRRWTGRVRFDDAADLASMVARVTPTASTTFKLVYGTTGWNAHVAAGYGAATLTVMSGSGDTTGFASALLLAVSNVRAAGRGADWVDADLDFAVFP